MAQSESSSAAFSSEALEEALRTAVLDAAELLVVVLDREARVLRFNRACEKATGFRASEVLGEPVWKLVPEEQRGHVEPVFNRLRSQGHPDLHENDWLTKSGRRRRIAWSNTTVRDPAGAVAFVIGTGIDVTELRQAEEARRGSESRLSGILDSAMDAVVSVDESQHVVLLNPAAELMFGRSRDELIGQPLDLLIPKRFRGVHREHVLRFGSTGQSNRRMGQLGRVWGRRANGEEFPVEASISQTRAGGARLFTVILRDVTERERAARTTETLASIVESTDDAIFANDLEGRILTWNRAAQRIFGYPAEEAIGRPVSMLVPQERREELARHGRTIAEGRSVDHAETVRLRRDGRRIDVALVLSPLRGPQGEVVGASAIARDVTTRRRLEQQLRQAQELASLGTLVAGLAHDIGTPLNVVLGYAEMLERSVGKPADRERVQTIREQVQRVVTLIQSLLGIARPSEPVRVAFQVEELLDKALGFLREKLERRKIVLDRNLEGVGEIHGDRERLERAFLNLLLNAVDAMPEGGTLRVSTRSGEADSVEIRIADTGVGIAPGELERIFEPFYTTKAPGQGSGLGLLVARGAVVDHGGSIEVQSALGKGTEFCLVLPVDGVAPGSGA